MKFQYVWRIFVLSFLGIDCFVEVCCQNVTLAADKNCYLKGETLMLNVTYRGNDSISVVEWNYQPDGESLVGSGLLVRTDDCRSFNGYPDNFPEPERVSFGCEQQTITERKIFTPDWTHYECGYMLKIDDMRAEEEHNAIWMLKLWLENALPLPAESVVIHECKDGRSTTSGQKTVTTSVVTQKTVNTPDMYNIIG